MRVLVTGATGFVGSTLCAMLRERGYLVRAALRLEHSSAGHFDERVIVGDIASYAKWDAVLRDVDFVIHLAARAHILNDAPGNAQLYAKTNQQATATLADAAARAGVRRFIFLSSVKVNGEDSRDGAYGPEDAPDPQDAYGTSKMLAERAIRTAVEGSDMDAAIVRPPLVYGPGVKANFLRLMHWVSAGRPLPLGAIANRRSLVSVWTLSDLLSTLLQHPAGAGTWMVSDGEDLSTPELIRQIGLAMGRPARLVAAPVGLLWLFGTITGRRAEVARLCGSLVVDIGATRARLGWSPPISAAEALRRTASWYFSTERSSVG